MTDRVVRTDSAVLTPEEIGDAVAGTLAYASRFGQTIDAKSLDLRLWAAAALIDSAIQVSIEAQIERSLEQKLAFMKGTRS